MGSYLIVVSDQHENWAVVGKSEGALVEPIGKAAVADLVARGHKAKYFDPQKSWSLALAMAFYPTLFSHPDAVVFIHINGGTSTVPMRVMGVDCSHAPNKAWSEGVIRSLANALPLFPYGGVFTDYALRGFCFWFYRRLRGYRNSSTTIRTLPIFRGNRTVLELGNMRNGEQAGFLWRNPGLVGRAISRAIAPLDNPPAVPLPELPVLRFPPTTKQPGVQIIKGYYADSSVIPALGYYPVIWLQRKLNAHYPAMTQLDIDGRFGKVTAARLMLFQREHYGADGKPLDATGITDTRTWAKLRSV